METAAPVETVAPVETAARRQATAKEKKEQILTLKCSPIHMRRDIRLEGKKRERSGDEEITPGDFFLFAKQMRTAWWCKEK